MTRLSSARNAPARRRRCSWPEKAIGCCWWTRSRFRATPVGRTSSGLTGAEIMDHWGLLDRLAATGCPPVARNMIFDVGPFALRGGVTDRNGGRGGFCPRRTVLDKILVDGAVESGAELREAFTVEQLDLGRRTGSREFEGLSRDGSSLVDRARIVIGADGKHSCVARVSPGAGIRRRATARDVLLQLLQRLPGGRCRAVRPRLLRRCMFPHQRWPHADGGRVAKRAIQGGPWRYRGARTGRCTSRSRASSRGCRARDVRSNGWGRRVWANYFRKPHGPGWALVGDAERRQGPDHRAGHKRRLHRCGEPDGSARRRLQRASSAGGCTGAVSLHPRSASKADAGFTRQLATLEPAPPPMRAAAVRRAARQSGGHEPVLFSSNWLDPATSVHEPGQHRANHRGFARRGELTHNGTNHSAVVHVELDRSCDKSPAEPC